MRLSYIFLIRAMNIASTFTTYTLLNVLVNLLFILLIIKFMMIWSLYQTLCLIHSCNFCL